MRSIRIRKFVVVPVADIVQDGEIVGEWQGNEMPVFRGSELFPHRLAEALEEACPKDQLEKL